ncbi:Meckel syndrome type 1 protein [Exaiptasia diaphana]|nr:Meckel syndrome type 1 protein [Exaiptasia diaphana]
MADFLENVEVGHYRSLDLPKNFALKVKLRKTTASFLPEFNIGSQQGINADDGAEAAGEAVEMPEIGRNRSQNKGLSKTDEETEEFIFHWQQKAFSQETRTLTTSPTEKPSFLVEKMLNVRRRNITSRRLDRRNRPGGFTHHVNPVTTYESEVTKSSAHVLSTHYRTMHIMADLAVDTNTSTEADEYTLCSIKFDINGQIFLKPDCNHGELPYRIETHTDSRDVYEYTIEHCSTQMTSEQQEQEMKSFNELYNRHALFLVSQVGMDFDYVPEAGVLKMELLGEIVSAKGFDYDGLYIHFFLELPQEWTSDCGPYLSGVTQTCFTKCSGKDNVAYFSFPFDFSLIYKEKEESDDFIRWPVLFIEVLSLDSWERHRTEGYGMITIPNQPGIHEITVNTWRPIGNGTVPELRRFFIGGSPELEDPTYPQQPVATEEKVLSKFYFRTVTSGSVTIRLNVIQQCQEFMESKKAKKRTRTILDRLGGLSALDSLGQVMDAFQRARQRMVAAREGLPIVK